MIQAAFSAGLVARLGGRHTAATARPATVVRAVRLAAVTRDTDRKQLVTGVAGLLAKRGVHGAAGNDCRGHWTPVPIRGTTEGDYLVVPRSSRWSRGPGGSVRVPTSSRSPQRTSARRARPRLGLRRSGRVAHSTGGRPGLFEATSPVRFKPPPSSASLGTTAPASRPAPSTEIQISALIPARPQGGPGRLQAVGFFGVGRRIVFSGLVPRTAEKPRIPTNGRRVGHVSGDPTDNSSCCAFTAAESCRRRRSPTRLRIVAPRMRALPPRSHV
jgi:hypothetical protein